MNYKNIVKGTFTARPNRFIAKVLVNGKEETVHVKNTGRCKELLVPGSTVYLEKSDNPQRKTAYDLVAVRKITENGEILINMDSQIPNACCAEFLPSSGLFSSEAEIKREVKFGNSRFDIFVSDNNKKAFIEVKGVTLEKDGLAPGKHKVGLKLYGTRQNGFAQVHHTPGVYFYQSPNSWREGGAMWMYEYQFKPAGILKSPQIFDKLI